jgi:NAD(P)-dependent dehydrogenase (short-subunit alcohol dehydrogenase family)
MLLDNQVAVVTGTGPNIGGQIARTLALNGAKVACLDIIEVKAQSIAKEITANGGQAIGVSGDIAKPDQVSDIFEKVTQNLGPVTILVNNAAITHGANILDTKLDDWYRILDVILTGTFLCSQTAAKIMVANNHGGAIVNIASTSGHRGLRGGTAYATAKGGILNLTRAMAIQLAQYKIRVNSVTPTETGIPVAGGRPRDEIGPPEFIPWGRWGRPIDQAQAVLFLASPNADFITGVDLPVDGGMLAQFPGQ